jgi:hypothetical protein
VSPVDVFRLAHLLGDDAAKFQGGAARSVFFHAMVALDDLHVDAGWIFNERAGRVAHELHREIDR